MLDVSFLQFLGDLANPQLAFLLRALIISVLAAVVCGVVGAYVVLRGMAFIGDAVAHAVFPGLAIAFALQTSVLLGGAIAGAVVAVLIALFSHKRRVREDSIIGIFFAAAFALGMVIISRVEGYTASLTSFLFGSLTGVSTADIVVSGAVAAVVLIVMALVRPQLTAVCLDRETARAMGLPVLALDLVLYLCVTAAVVMSVATIGNVLVLALLVTPAATARLITRNLGTLMVVAAALGAAGSFLGIYLAWAIDLPAGATIVLTLTCFFFIAWVLGPRVSNKTNHRERISV